MHLAASPRAGFAVDHQHAVAGAAFVARGEERDQAEHEHGHQHAADGQPKQAVEVVAQKVACIIAKLSMAWSLRFNKRFDGHGIGPQQTNYPNLSSAGEPTCGGHGL